MVRVSNEFGEDMDLQASGRDKFVSTLKKQFTTIFEE